MQSVFLLHIYMLPASFALYKPLHSQAPISANEVMVQKFNLGKKDHVIIPDKKNWRKGPSVRANWYTYGFKTEYGVGVGQKS